VKKITALCLLLIFAAAGPVQALSWAYPFVAWNGHVYKVTEERVGEGELGAVIGEVKQTADEVTGDYSGDASNFYEKGTKYYEIKEIPSQSAIAVEAKEDEWLKAVYVHEAPFHWTDVFTTWLPLLFLTAAGAALIWKWKKKRMN
jgi:hypothetical protein